MSITESTETREALPTESTQGMLFYIDNDRTHIEYSGVLNEGFRYFYEKTGVRPFLFIYDEGFLDSSELCRQVAARLYDNYIDDENCLFLVYSRIGANSWTGYCLGEDIGGVMDDEALEILDDYIYYYINELDDGKISYEDAFADILLILPIAL